MSTHDRKRLFIASCLALAVTAFMFILRGGVEGQVMREILVDGEAMNFKQYGRISSTAFYGFAASILIASPLLDFFGLKRTFMTSCILQVVGLVGFISTSNYQIMVFSMLIAGFGNGLVEAVINPLCAAEYPDEKTHRMNVLHAWWPGGLIIGGLIGVYVFDAIGLNWRIQMGAIIVPALAFGALIFNQKFPQTERATAGISGAEMAKTVLHPAFILLMVCMMMTASAELAPGQWVNGVIQEIAGTSGTLVLVYGSALMFVLRYFAGPIAHVISPIGMMCASTAITAVGLYLIAGAKTGPQAYMYATVFFIGVCFMWPTMLGIAAERFPKGGAMTIGFLGFIGQLALGIVITYVGEWKDGVGSEMAFKYVAVLPSIACAIFAAWWVRDYMTGGYKAINLVKEMETAKS